MPYAEEIIDGIQTCRVMVLVLSANANASPHIPKEIERAVSRGIPVIPLRVENVTPGKSLDYFISSVHWLDAITPPLEQHLENLANTILAILPQSPHIIRPYPVPPPPAPPPPPPTPSGGGGTPKWLLPAVAVILVLVVAGWFFWGRGSSSESRQVPIINPGSESQPGSVLHAPTPAAGTSDPIAGCWRWTNNLTVVINSDGTIVAGPFTGRWQATDTARRIYHLTWPEAVDTTQLSGDGRSLTGGNQYGFAMSATRLTAGPDIVGSWRWYNGVIVIIRQDGYFSAAGITGHWQMTTPGTYALTWPKPVDTVSLSSNRRQLQGGNQYGIRLSATKLSSCGGA